MACDFLLSKGKKVICRNYRCKYGEIDIIYRDGEYIVFCEVKYRKDPKKGDPTEAVYFAKQKKISSTAIFYLMSKKYKEDTPIRFDVISILGSEVTLYKNAFEPVIY